MGNHRRTVRRSVCRTGAVITTYCCGGSPPQSLPGVVDRLRLLLDRRQMPFLRERSQSLLALSARLRKPLLGLERRLVALAFDRFAVLQVDALELVRLAEELMAARIAIRRQRRIHI